MSQEIDFDKLKKRYEYLPKDYDVTIAEKLNVSASHVKYVRYESAKGKRKFRDKTLDIINALVGLANQNMKDNDKISKINELLS